MSHPKHGAAFLLGSVVAAAALAGALSAPAVAGANVLDPALYVRSSDGSVYEKKLQSTGWGAWNSLGKPGGHQIVSDVALNVGQQGEKQLWALGEDGHIYVTYEASGYASGWHPWSDFGLAWGGGFKGNKVAPFTENGSGKVAAISGGGNPFLNYTTASGWSGWSPISSGVGFRNLTVNNHAGGHAELYGVGDDSNVYATYVYSGGWHPLYSLGKPAAGNFVGGLSANTGVHGENQLFGVADDGYIWASYQTAAFANGWHPWYRMPRPATGLRGNVATFRGFDGRIGVVARGMNETAYNIVAGDSSVYPIGSIGAGKAFVSDISANRHLEGGTNQLFAVGSDGDLYQSYQINGGSSSGLNNGWHPWYSIGKLPPGSGLIQGNVATFPGGTRMVDSSPKIDALIALLRRNSDGGAQGIRNGLWASEAAHLAQSTTGGIWGYRGPNLKIDTQDEVNAFISAFRSAGSDAAAQGLYDALLVSERSEVDSRMRSTLSDGSFVRVVGMPHVWRYSVDRDGRRWKYHIPSFVFADGLGFDLSTTRLISTGTWDQDAPTQGLAYPDVGSFMPAGANCQSIATMNGASQLGVAVPWAARVFDEPASRASYYGLIRCFRQIAPGKRIVLRTQTTIDVGRRPDDNIKNYRTQLTRFIQLAKEIDATAIITFRGVTSNAANDCPASGPASGITIVGTDPGTPLGVCEIPSVGYYDTLVAQSLSEIAPHLPDAYYSAWNEPDHPGFSLRNAFMTATPAADAAGLAGEYWAKLDARVPGRALAGEFSDASASTLATYKSRFASGAALNGRSTAGASWSIHPYSDFLPGVAFDNPSATGSSRSRTDSFATPWLSEVGPALWTASGGATSLHGYASRQLESGARLRARLANGGTATKLALYMVVPPPANGPVDLFDSALGDRSGAARKFVCGLGQVPESNCTGSAYAQIRP